MRIGFLVVIFGVMAAASTITNDSARGVVGSHSFDLSAKEQINRPIYPIRRTTRVIVESSVDFRGSLYILDETGIKRWLEEDVFEPLVTVDIYGGASVTFEPPRRGLYDFIIYNDTNETHEIAWSYRQYGLEYDLLSASGVITVVGGVLIILGIVKSEYTPQKTPNHKRR